MVLLMIFQITSGKGRALVLALMVFICLAVGRLLRDWGDRRW